MMVIPAIDIMDGQVVRLLKGDEKSKTSYSKYGSPLEVAKHWLDEGAEYIHIIDLDATLSRGNNQEIIQLIIDEIDIHIQFGGGIRNLEYAQQLLNKGVNRIILGSMAMKSFDSVINLRDEFGENRIIVALDHRKGTVLDKGWKASTGKSLEEVFWTFSDNGIKWFLITDTNRDGTLEGPDLETYAKFSKNASIIASGGVGSLNDLKKLNKTGAKAVVIGKALYEGVFTLPEALAQLEVL